MRARIPRDRAARFYSCRSALPSHEERSAERSALILCDPIGKLTIDLHKSEAPTLRTAPRVIGGWALHAMRDDKAALTVVFHVERVDLAWSQAEAGREEGTAPLPWYPRNHAVLFFERDDGRKVLVDRHRREIGHVGELSAPAQPAQEGVEVAGSCNPAPTSWGGRAQPRAY